MKAILFTVFTIALVEHIHANAHAICNKTTGACCADFQLKDGICEPCFGTWGPQCTQNCSKGFYGFGCRSECLCLHNQLCHKILGCIENLTSGKDESTPRLLSNVLLATSICTGSLCVVLIIYILGKRFTSKQKVKRRAIDFQEQEGRLEVELPAPIDVAPDCISQNSVAIIYKKSPSSCGHTIHSILQTPNRRRGSFGGEYSPMCSSQESLDTEHPFAGAHANCSLYYDKCRLNPEEYEQTSFETKTRKMNLLPKQSPNCQVFLTPADKKSKSKYLGIGGRIYC